MLGLLALNDLPTTDVVMFVVLGLIVAAIVAVYFLMPVINKKQYQEMRDNLAKREIAFKTNATSNEEEVASESDNLPTDKQDE